MSKVSKLLLATAVAGAAMSSVHAAPVGQPVTIQEGAITGAAPNVVNVDQLSGQYDEVVTVTPTSLVGGTFVTEAIFNAGGWFKNGSAANTQLNFPEGGVGPFAIGAGIGYGLYAKFSQAGTYTFTGGQFVFTGFTAGKLELWADPKQDTNYDVKATATGDIANLDLVSGAASITDDLLLGTANTVLLGAGSSQPGVANGNFEIIFNDFALANPNGESYFIQPRPFYLLLDVNGNFQSFDPTAATSTQLLNNSANAFFFKAPEPNALAMVGLALVALGFASRRKKV